MSWWRRFGAWGSAIEVDMGLATVGLCLGTMDPETGGAIRREIEAEIAAAMGVPAEMLESEIRALIASKVRR